jgi:hypothetical protein
MEFPETIDIQAQTYTVDVLPYITQMPNRTISTMYETLGLNASTATDLQLQEEYTWIVNGMTLYVCSIEMSHS